jgi:hypothetical protein
MAGLTRKARKSIGKTDCMLCIAFLNTDCLGRSEGKDLPV